MPIAHYAAAHHVWLMCRLIRVRTHYHFALLASVAVLINGCSSTPQEINPDPETKEIVAKKDNDIDSPEEILFQSAKKSYQNQLYSVAKDQFSALMHNFPTGPFVEYAELKVADCSFFIRDFDVCAPQYEEYAKNHPGSLSASYALLMAARSYHLSSKGVGHDAHALERARETYGRLLEQYPDSVYAKQAAAYQKAAIDDLTANEIAVADFYKKRGQESAYNSRMKIIREKWQPLAMNVQKTFDAYKDKGVSENPDTSLAEPRANSSDSTNSEASDKVIENDLAEENEAAGEEASHEESAPEDEETEETADAETDTSAELVSDVESSEVEAPESGDIDAKEEHGSDSDSDEEQTSSDDDTTSTSQIVAEHSVPTPTSRNSVIEQQSQNSELPHVAQPAAQEIKLLPPAARVSIQRVECSGKSAYLHLDREWSDKGFLTRNSMLVPRDGIISITLPLTKGTGKTYNCFTRADLIVASNGTVTIATNKPMFVHSAANPARLAFSVKNF